MKQVLLVLSLMTLNSCGGGKAEEVLPTLKSPKSTKVSYEGLRGTSLKLDLSQTSEVASLFEAEFEDIFKVKGIELSVISIEHPSLDVVSSVFNAQTFKVILPVGKKIDILIELFCNELSREVSDWPEFSMESCLDL